jgi:hypothetical protein
MRALLTSICAVAGALLAFQGQAAAPLQFSADTVQTSPQGQITGKLYISNGRMRTDMLQDGHQLIQIVDPSQQVSWTVFPENKSYMERRGQVSPAAGAPTQASGTSPCQNAPEASCRSLGQRSVAGRTAEGWEITVTREGKTIRGTQWNDVARGVPLLQEFEGGPKSELKMVGKDTVDGRPVEKWELSITQPDGKMSGSTQWYDPALNLTVREEWPGGYVRELRNIKVGPQPDDLFRVPSGYQQVTPPASLQQSGQSGGGSQQWQQGR